MSHIVSHETIFLLFQSERVTLHEAHLLIYVITIAFNIIYNLIVMQKRCFFEELYLEIWHYFKNHVTVMSLLYGYFFFDITALVATLQSATSKGQTQLDHE